jgi:hypothetical protein
MWTYSGLALVMLLMSAGSMWCITSSWKKKKVEASVVSDNGDENERKEGVHGDKNERKEGVHRDKGGDGSLEDRENGIKVDDNLRKIRESLFGDESSDSEGPTGSSCAGNEAGEYVEDEDEDKIKKMDKIREKSINLTIINQDTVNGRRG